MMHEVSSTLAYTSQSVDSSSFTALDAVLPCCDVFNL